MKQKLIVGQRSNSADISFGHDDKTHQDILMEAYADDVKYGGKLVYHSSLLGTSKSFKNSYEFLFPHGVCQMDYAIDTTHVIRIFWPGSYPNVVAYLTDPGMLTHSSIDLNSQVGDKMTCNFGNICTYEISIMVTELRHPVIPDTCSDETSYDKCVEEQTKNIYDKVKTKKKKHLRKKTNRNYMINTFQGISIKSFKYLSIC